MRFGVGKRTIQVAVNMTGLSPSNHLVFRTEEDEFYEYVEGEARRYFDPSLGLVKYRGRQYIRTEATSFVRDGTEFIVLLPSENKCVRRPALHGDDSFVEHDFGSDGIWNPANVATESLFGFDERVANSFTLAGQELLTRRNGEVFLKTPHGPTPFFVTERSGQQEFVRIDLEVPDSDGRRVVTLFLEPKRTAGAKQWLSHFADTQAVVKHFAPEASPILRNYNTVFYNGELDLKRCIESLQDAVREINKTYKSNLDSSDNGSLWMPTLSNTDSHLLNQLHFEFENFGERFKKGSPAEQQSVMPAYGPFCRLNDCIHATEGALANRHRSLEEAWWSLHCAFLPDFYKALPDALYEEFTLDWKFGTMYMGYHTLGKDIVAAFWNDDLDLFRRNEIRPQRISSAEIFLFLGPDSVGQTSDLKTWWERKRIEQFGYVFGDPRNSIGYIPVASLQTHGLSESEIKVAIKGCRRILNVALVKV